MLAALLAFFEPERTIVIFAGGQLIHCNNIIYFKKLLFLRTTKQHKIIMTINITFVLLNIDQNKTSISFAT